LRLRKRRGVVRHERIDVPKRIARGSGHALSGVGVGNEASAARWDREPAARSTFRP